MLVQFSMPLNISGSAPVMPNVQGYSGQLSISSNTFVNGANGAGNLLQLKGVNNSGLEVCGFFNSTAASWGGNGAPNWALLGQWASTMSGTQALITRIPLNSASFLQLPVYTPTNATTWGALLTSGGNGTADPYNDYKAAIVTAIQACRAIKCYIIFDLHWGAMQLTLGGVTHYGGYQGQLAFMDTTGLTFWQSFVSWLQTNFGPGGTYNNPSFGGASGYGDIGFELFNEPFMGTGTYSAGSADLTLLNGGTGNTYITNGAGNITTPVTYTGYQACVNAIRGLGATNPIICNGNQYAQNLQNYTIWKPTDSANQIAFGNHPYSAAAYPYTGTNTVYPLVGTDSGGPTSWPTHVQAILTAGYPVIITEDGCDSGNNAGTSYGVFEPHMTYTSNYAVANSLGYMGWTYGAGDYIEAYATSGAANVMLRENATSSGIWPISGEGWMMYLFISGNAAPTIITGTTLPAGGTGSPYSETFVATGGAGGSFTWAEISDSGSGLTLNTSTGVLSGTLTATAGTYSIVIQAQDQYGIKTPQTTFSLQVTSGGLVLPSAPPNLQLIQQGGTSNSLTNSQKYTWGASTAGTYPIASYNVYRNGGYPGSPYANTTALTYTDTNAPNSNQQNTFAPSTPYTYTVAAVDNQGNIGPQQTTATCYWYQNGVPAQGTENFSYSLTTLNWSASIGGQTCIEIVSPPSSGFQPVSFQALCPDYGMEIGGGFNYFMVDVYLTDNTTTMFHSEISRPGYPGSTDYYPLSQVNIWSGGTSPYGTIVLNQWCTLKVPITATTIGVTTFHGYISGTTVTQVGSVISGPGADGGGYITGAGVAAGTFIDVTPGNANGPFTVNNSQTVGSAGSPVVLTCTRQNVYKIDFGNNASPTTTYYLNNIRWSTT
jgi:Cellulase (glycosyl hydrolase family 5)